MPPMTSSGKQSKPTVLLVEDDARVRELMALHLRGRDFEVIECGALTPALEILSQGFAPHVCVLDLHLPNGMGLDVVRALLGAKGRWPIVIVTASYDDRWATEAYGLSPRVQQYILKNRLSWFTNDNKMDDTVSITSGVTLGKLCIDAMSRYRSHVIEVQAETAKAVKESVPTDMIQKAANRMGVYGFSDRRLWFIAGSLGVLLVGIGGVVAKLSEWPERIPPSLVGATLIAAGVALSAFVVRRSKG